MAGVISRGRDGLVFWEDEQCSLSFEATDLAPGSPGTVERFGKAAGRPQACVAKDGLVDMEGNVDIANLDAVLQAAVDEINAWLRTN